MRTPLLFCIASMVLSSLLLLGGCSYQNDGYQNDGYRNGRYQNNSAQNRQYQSSQYGRQDSYSYSEYHYYYPYGQANYPRDRIYIVQANNTCNGNSYRGYCYRYEDDCRRAKEYDRSKGYDDRWYKQQQSYCSTHNCRRDGNEKRHGNGKPDSRHDDHKNDDHKNENHKNDHDRDNRDGKHDNKPSGFENSDRNTKRYDRDRDITPASQDGRYDARDRVLERQQQDPDKVIKRHLGMDKRQDVIRGQGQAIDLPRYQGGEDRLNDPKPETRQEAGASAGIHDNGREHRKQRTSNLPEAMHSEPPAQQEQERPVFVEPPREERPAFEPPMQHEMPDRVEPPVMREPEPPVFVEPPRQERPAFESPVQRERPERYEPPVMREQERPVFVEPPRQERPAFEPPVQREQERPVFIEPPPRQQEPERRSIQEDIQLPQAPAELPPTEAPAQ